MPPIPETPRSIEVNGLAPDPNCLHCYLAPVIDRWRAQHRDKPGLHIILELVEVVGEFLASGAQDEATMQRALAMCEQHLREKAAESWESFKPFRTPQ